jgi:hypothetical protein
LGRPACPCCTARPPIWNARPTRDTQAVTMRSIWVRSERCTIADCRRLCSIEARSDDSAKIELSRTISASPSLLQIMIAPTSARRTTADHPALPVTEEAIAETVAARFEADAGRRRRHWARPTNDGEPLPFHSGHLFHDRADRRRVLHLASLRSPCVIGLRCRGKEGRRAVQFGREVADHR